MPSRRPRPVADAPIAGLEDGVAVAKGWLLALLAERPLDGAAGVHVGELAREAPALAAAMLRALASDAELERLGPGGDLAGVAARAGVLGGAGSPAETAAVVEALRACAWHELTAELPRLDARHVADLADRLGHVCALVAQAALREPAAHASAQATPLDPAAPAATYAPPLDRAHAGPQATPFDAAPCSPPHAVLAVEIDDCERLLASSAGSEGETLLAGAEHALASALGPADELTRLGAGRYRVTARGADATAAHSLAQRIAAAISASAAPHAVPLRASIGVAVAPRDGDDADALAAHAERALFAARAEGMPAI